MDSPEKRLLESSSDFSATNFPEKNGEIFRPWMRGSDLKRRKEKNTKFKQATTGPRSANSLLKL